MARKFCNSSNSMELGALTLFDFLPFVIPKPQRQFRQNRTIPGEMRPTLLKVGSNFYIVQTSQFSKIFQFRIFATISQSFTFPSVFFSQTLHLLDSEPFSMPYQECHFKTGQNYKTVPYQCPKVVGENIQWLIGLNFIFQLQFK